MKAVRLISGIAAILGTTTAMVEPSRAQNNASGPWLALVGGVQGHTSRIVLSGKSPSRQEAIEKARMACDDQMKGCVVIDAFNSGCRFVLLGGKPIGNNLLEGVFVVGLTKVDAAARCGKMGLTCEAEPQGGCVE